MDLMGIFFNVVSDWFMLNNLVLIEHFLQLAARVDD